MKTTFKHIVPFSYCAQMRSTFVSLFAQFNNFCWLSSDRCYCKQ